MAQPHSRYLLADSVAELTNITWAGQVRVSMSHPHRFFAKEFCTRLSVVSSRLMDVSSVMSLSKLFNAIPPRRHVPSMFPLPVSLW